jgi:5-methylthioadenosine/S-adenosylhomocysteine deaminase
MFESMKFAALGQKMYTSDPTALSATEVFEMATRSGSISLGVDSGVIAPGKLADLVLINLKNHAFTPNHNLISNIVYSANGSCVDATICDGKILMMDGEVEGEEDILLESQKTAFELIKRSEKGEK